LTTQYQTNMESYLKSYVTTFTSGNVAFGNASMMQMFEMPMKQIETKITEIAATDLSIKLDFTKHPNFDNNHNRPAQDDDKITDPFRKEEYHRIMDQCDTANKTLLELHDQLVAAIKEEEQKVAVILQSIQQ
jgi:hypothetical protein